MAAVLQGNLTHQKQPPPLGSPYVLRHMAAGICLLYGGRVGSNEGISLDAGQGTQVRSGSQAAPFFRVLRELLHCQRREPPPTPPLPLVRLLIDQINSKLIFQVRVHGGEGVSPHT